MKKEGGHESRPEGSALYFESLEMAEVRTRAENNP
jgi:hypothetical protein